MKIEHQKISVILNKLNESIFELQEFYEMDRFNLVVPRYFQELLNRYMQAVPFKNDNDQYLYGIKIVDGYEDALIIYCPMDFKLKKERIKRIELNLLKK